MRSPIKSGKTTISMEQKDFGHGVTAWQIVYEKDGTKSARGMMFDTESDADAAMDEEKKQADAYAEICSRNA